VDGRVKPGHDDGATDTENPLGFPAILFSRNAREQANTRYSRNPTFGVLKSNRNPRSECSANEVEVGTR
jgi:hypothetical protein